MPVIINFKICDNAEACNAINVCPTGAFHWNSEKKTLEIDKDKCIECGACATSEKSCQIGAIRFARTKEALEQIKKEIAEDPRTISDLQADRYGATPINMPFSCSENELDSVLTTTKTCLIEVYNEDSIECLIKSIPVKEILKEIDNSTYRKVEVKSEDFKKKYSINELPSLLIFKDKNLLGKIEGYYSVDEKDSLIEKINKILE